MSTADQARRRRDEIRAGTYVRAERALDLPWPRSDGDGTPLGVDLEAEWDLVRRETRASSTRPPALMSWEDLEQEVCLVIHRRNRMPSAHDPRRSGLANYVRMVARCVAANLASRTLDVLPREPMDVEALPSLSDEPWREGAAKCVLELRDSGRASEGATGYCLEVLASGHGAGTSFERTKWREEVRAALGADGASGP